MRPSGLVFCFISLSVAVQVKCGLEFSKTSLRMLVKETAEIELIMSKVPTGTIEFIVEHNQILQVTPRRVTIYKDNDKNATKVIMVEALAAGESQITTASSFSGIQDIFLTVQIYKSEFIEIFSEIMGWGYFLAWSISFYPQIYENIKRKSVVGLNFDFLVINLTGYLCYAAFNLGLYYIPQIKEEYSQRYPRSIISVFPNDIFFAVHGIILTGFTCLQCLWYERGGQKISWFGKAFHYVTAAVLILSAILSACGVIQWLDFLYICSYIKLTVTICKYAPQAIMNYKRRSTDGWSIEAILLDVAGGVLSIIQMFLNAYNYEKWEWILENPTKLGLGILSLLFDFIFMVQHYGLYKESRIIDKRRRQSEADKSEEANSKIIENNVLA